MVARALPDGKRARPDPSGRRQVIGQLMALALSQAAPLRAGEPDLGLREALTVAPLPGLAARRVTVWLPPGFDPRHRHAVLYVHDGQMQFDAAHTWNHQAWHLDQAASRLLEAGTVRRFLIVAIDNDPQRRTAEFFPQAALDAVQPPALREAFITQALGGRPAADTYLQWIVERVKPAVDARYPTLPGRDDTFMMGSSLGALISLSAACRYPSVFGGVAALSSHWIGSMERNTAIPAALRQYLAQQLPPPTRLRLYLDRGTEGLDALYDDAQRDIDALLQQLGFGGPNFASRVFAGATHDEASWAARVDQPLRLLLGRSP